MERERRVLTSGREREVSANELTVQREKEKIGTAGRKGKV